MSAATGWLLATALIVLIAMLLFAPKPADGGIIPAPHTHRVTWKTSRADTLVVKATYLAEAEPTTSKNGDPGGICIADAPGTGTRRAALVMWAESIPDSVPATFTSATLTVYRLNGTDGPAVYDTLEVAPVTVTWNEGKATWLSRATGKLWFTPGGDVDTSHAVLVRAENIPNLCAGAADSAVSFDITPIVAAWRDRTVASYGLRLAWRSGVSPAIRFHDNAAAESLRPVLTIETVTTHRARVIGVQPRFGVFPQGWRRP